MILFLTVIHVLMCFILIVAVLLQRGKGAEIGAVFGGGGSSTVFGSRGAGNFLSRLTTGAAILFFATSLTLTILGSGQRGSVFGEPPQPDAAQPAAGGAFEEVAPPVAPTETAPQEPTASAKPGAPAPAAAGSEAAAPAAAGPGSETSPSDAKPTD